MRRNHAAHDGVVADRRLAVDCLEVAQLLVDILGNLSGKNGIGRRRAVTIGTVAGNANSASDFLGFRQIRLVSCLFRCDGGETDGQENRKCRCTNHVQTPIDNND
jgi:hypothetical protein